MSRRLAFAALLSLASGGVLAQTMPHHAMPMPGGAQTQAPATATPGSQPQGCAMMQGGGMQGCPMMQARPAQMPMQMPMPQPANPAAAQAPSTQAFIQGTEKMHRDMAIQYTGDTDRDFAAGMIPHHQAAIDMARVQLQYGRNPEMRTLAESIIRDQEREIAQLRAYLASVR